MNSKLLFHAKKTGCSVYSCGCGCDGAAVIAPSLITHGEQRYYIKNHGPAWGLEGPAWNGDAESLELLERDDVQEAVDRWVADNVSREFDDPHRTMPIFRSDDWLPNEFPKEYPIIDDEASVDELADLFNITADDFAVSDPTDRIWPVSKK